MTNTLTWPQIEAAARRPHLAAEAGGDATPYTVIDASGRMWPAEGAELARMWNRCKPLRAYCDAYRMANFIGNVRHTLSRNVNDYAPRGPSRNRAGAGNRRWRKYEAARGRVIFSAPFFDIVE